MFWVVQDIVRKTKIKLGLWQGDPKYSEISGEEGMATVIWINWDWMKDYGWKVISEDQMESIGKEFVMYSDLGYGNYLECKRVDGVF